MPKHTSNQPYIDQARDYLTKADLEDLQRKIEAGKLVVEVISSNPTVEVRGQFVPLFIILEQLGTL